MENPLSIDVDCLDEEWVRQPDLMVKYTEELSKASKQLDEAKAALELVQAELDKAIRSNPETYGLDKVTESGVDKATIRSKKYQKAKQAEIEAKHKKDLLLGVVQSLNHKKAALESLVSLHSMGYFASPKEDKDANTTLMRRRSKHKRRKSNKPN